MAEDTITKLGKLQMSDQGRDAIHIAVLTMQAKEEIYAYGLQGVDRFGGIVRPDHEIAIGIVDPFLPQDTQISPGEWFYVYLKPGTISGLKHVWSHAEFGEEGPKPVTRAMERIQRFCASVGIQTGDFLGVFVKGSAGSLTLRDDYIHASEDAYGEIPEEILRDVEEVTGKTLTRRPTHFSCSC
jgi:hypothetical protein